MTRAVMRRAGRGPSVCPCCLRPSVAVLCPACRRPVAYVRCGGTRRRWTTNWAPQPSGEFWIDPLREYVASSVTGFRRLGTGTDPVTGALTYEDRGPRITLCCTRACGATPSRAIADILAAAHLCLEAGLTEFRLPD